jgi:hypothetical protein
VREPDGWIDLADFTPGIVHYLAQAATGPTQVGSAPGRDGAASIENTYRCICLPNGGLGPMPANNWNYSRPSMDATIATWRMQFFVYGPLTQDYIDPRSMAVTHPVEFHLAAEGNAGGATRRHRWYRDRVFQGGPTLAAANVDQIKAVDVASTVTTQFNPTSFAAHYMDVGGGQGAYPAVLASYNALAGNITGGYTGAFPNSTSVATVAAAVPYLFTWTSGGGWILSHQGRVVEFLPVSNTWGPSVYSEQINDYFQFSSPQLAGQDGTTRSIVTQDSMAGVGAVGSISASDLLIVTHGRGGVLVQGDLANPTVRRMPGVVPTGGTECTGIPTPVGFVYGVNRGGIYAWSGGDSSTLLSHQLPEDCWIIPNTASILRYKGRFALWQNWIMCPGNWVYNIPTSSWWRMEDPAVNLFYEWMVNPVNGYCYGNVPLWTDGGAQMVGYINGFDRSTGTHSWSWQSQPLARTRNRTLSIRDVDLVCQGAGTIAVTFTAADGTTQTNTYTLSGSTTLSQYLRTTFGVVGNDVKVRFLATGTGGAGVAPVLHVAHIGYNERQHLGAG